MDPYARRYAAAEAMVREWQVRPPESPVIIAGSTGATPASRLLMQAAMQLPKGVVVLPGLDRDLSPTIAGADRRVPVAPAIHTGAHPSRARPLILPLFSPGRSNAQTLPQRRGAV